MRKGKDAGEALLVFKVYEPGIDACVVPMIEPRKA